MNDDAIFIIIKEKKRERKEKPENFFYIAISSTYI
jgi:hypothetical protein